MVDVKDVQTWRKRSSPGISLLLCSSASLSIANDILLVTADSVCTASTSTILIGCHCLEELLGINGQCGCIVSDKTTSSSGAAQGKRAKRALLSTRQYGTALPTPSSAATLHTPCQCCARCTAACTLAAAAPRGYLPSWRAPLGPGSPNPSPPRRPWQRYPQRHWYPPPRPPAANRRVDVREHRTIMVPIPCTLGGARGAHVRVRQRPAPHE